MEHNRNMCLIYTWPGISRSRPESEPSARLLDGIFSGTGRDSNIPDRRSREYASSPSFRSCTGRSPVSEQQVMIRENDGGGCLKRKSVHNERSKSELTCFGCYIFSGLEAEHRPAVETNGGLTTEKFPKMSRKTDHVMFLDQRSDPDRQSLYFHCGSIVHRAHDNGDLRQDRF